MEKIWGLVLEASFYGSIVGIVILIAKNILKNKLTGRFHYLIWILLILKLIIPIGPKSDISIFNSVPNNNVSQIIIEDNNKNYEHLNKSKNDEVVKVDDSISENYKTNNTIKSRIKDYIPIIWIIGAINVGAAFLISQYFLCKEIRLNNKGTKDNLDEVLLKCKIKMKINRNIKIVINDFVNTPSLVGVFNPKILMPDLMTNLSNKELEYIFLHELAHYKRKDIVSNYIILIFQAIHWFNPIIWYLFKKVREDMELATDERVLKLLDDNEHKEYGKAILTVLERIKSHKLTPGILGIIEDKNTVKKRINMIKNMKLMKRKNIVFTIVGIASIVLLGTVLLTSANIREDELNYAKSLYEHKSDYIGDASLKSTSKDLKSFNELLLLLEEFKSKGDDLEQLISQVLINSQQESNDGELITEGHTILQKEEVGNDIKVYLVASTGSFGFENDVFTLTSGYSVVPMIMNFSRNESGELYHIDTELPKDGSYYESSIRKMFPNHFKNILNETDRYKHILDSQQEEQAKKYLNVIGRNAKVQTNYVDKKLANINVNAANELLQDEKLSDYPYWIGSREAVVDDVRYKYEKTHYKENNEDFIVYTKNVGKKIVEQYKYKIVGDKPVLIEDKIK